MDTTIATHRIGTRDEWLAAREALLVREKAHTRLGDELARERRALPWVRVEEDYRFDVRSPGRLFAVTASGGELLLELPGVYPNGIAFDADGRLYWTESMAHRLMRLEDGRPATFCQLSDGHVPDGMAFAADGRLFVCTTVSKGVTVVSAEGEVLDEIHLGEDATNCAFAGSTLYVTATHVAEIEASQRTGTLWSVETDATGLSLIPGAL